MSLNTSFSNSINQIHTLCNETIHDIKENKNSNSITEKVNSIINQSKSLVSNLDQESYIHIDLTNLASALSVSHDVDLKSCAKKVNDLISTVTTIQQKGVNKPLTKNDKLEMDGIFPDQLKKCPRLFFRESITVARELREIDTAFAKEIGDLSPYNPEDKQPVRPEETVTNYLVTHPNDNDPLRKAMSGYIGYKEPEIQRNLNAACWNLATAGCCGTSGPDKLEKYINPDEFYTIFNSNLFSDDPLIDEIGRKIVKYEDLQNNGWATANGVSSEIYKKLLPHKKEIEAIWAKMTNDNSDLESLGKNILTFYLKSNGFEVLSDEEAANSPYSIAMYTPDCKTIGWQHWGIEVSTKDKTYTFETLPYCSIGFRKESFKTPYEKPGENFVFSIPIRDLPDRQKQRIKETLKLGSNG